MNYNTVDLFEVLSITHNRTTSSDKDMNAALVHSALGIAGEAGEIVDRIKKIAIYGKPFTEVDKINLIEEMGDVMWYLEKLRSIIDVSWDEVIIGNSKKLSKRYPEKFSTEDALARADKIN